jgi:ABC-type oligopeptide transport system ATPase subunit
VPEENLVVVESVSFAYDRRPILKNISMRVPRGKVVAIMGASGSGKTTLLRLIGGQIRPTAGTIRVAGRDVGSLDARGLYALRRDMSMLFQLCAARTGFGPRSSPSGWRSAWRSRAPWSSIPSSSCTTSLSRASIPSPWRWWGSS